MGIVGSGVREKRGRVHEGEGRNQRPADISGCINIATRFMHSTNIYQASTMCQKTGLGVRDLWVMKQKTFLLSQTV